ncbi:MAG: rhomboid family intramembrane serine protease [Butyrivibrio sp.]|nr:rhomboid family intramembrane serine protease [Butyrivibrio sp.]
MQQDAYDRYWNHKKQITLQSYITLALVAVNCILLLITMATGDILYTRFSLVLEKVIYDRQLFRLISSIFIHADISHLFGNMIMLILIGPELEKTVGHMWYLFIYLVSGIAGNIVSLIYESIRKENWISYGASGAVFGIVGAVGIVIFLNRKALLKRGSDLPIRMGFMIVYALYSGFTTTSVNNAAHIGGFLVGAALMYLFLLYNRRNITMEVYL